MNVEDFIEKYTGIPDIGNTPENRGQCVGLVSVYCDTWDAPHIWGNAKDLYTNAGMGYDKSDNYPAPKGSCAIYNGYYGNGYGHTGVSLGDGRLFEQNDPEGHAPQTKNYTSDHYIGWIRPSNYKETGEDMPLTEDQVKYLYTSGLGREAMTSDVQGNVGKDPGVLIDAIRSSAERGQYQDFETTKTYEGFLGRVPEKEALSNARTESRVKFVNDVQNSQEAKDHLNKEFIPVTDQLYKKG